MCDPISALMLLGTGMSAYGQYQAGRTEAAMIEHSAKQTEADAKAERGAAMVEAERIRKAGKMQRAQAVAQLAGSGVDVGEGTALVIDKEITSNAEQDAFLTIVGGNDRALRMENQAILDKMRAKSVKRGATIGAFSTVLGGTMQAGNQMGWKLGSQKGKG